MTTDNATPEQFVQDELKLSMYVPADAAGKIIGKRGIVVTNLKRETQASFITALKPVGGSLWTAVIVLGTLESVSATYDAIANIVDNGSLMFIWFSNYLYILFLWFIANVEVDDVILEFTFNRFKQHSFLTAGNYVFWIVSLNYHNSFLFTVLTVQVVTRIKLFENCPQRQMCEFTFLGFNRALKQQR